MKRFIRRGAIGSLALAIVAGTLLSFPVEVAAKSGGVTRTGNCTGSSDWKLKAKPDDGRIEVEFEVDSNRIGQVWTVKLKDNGHIFWRGHRTTVAPSGSFSVTRRTANRVGTDKIVGRAVNQKSGEVCRGSLAF